MTVTGMFIWLGGGQPAELDDRHERTGYAVTGAGVASTALVAAAVTATALALSEKAPAAPATMPLVTAAIALTAGLVTGLIGRAMAGAESTARLDRPAGTPNLPATVGRISVAVLIGVLLAETAATAVFDDAIDRLLDERAATAASTAADVRAARSELDRARAERAALTGTIAAARSDIDSALIVARCEYNPTPLCPQTKITGVPGRGPESQAANAMLDDARARLAAAETRIAPLDQRIADGRRQLSDAETAAFAHGDRGLGARWTAMNEHTGADRGALALRLLGTALFLLLALLPLILRWWRGETSLDRRRAARAVQDRADLGADTAIAVTQAQMRTETETLRAEQQLASARLAAAADTAIDRERQRTRVIAAIGGLEIGVVEPLITTADSVPDAVRDRHDGNTAAELPAPATPKALPAGNSPDISRTKPAPPRGLELPLIGAVPFTDTAVRWIGPLVPSFVTTAVNTATLPLRLAQQALDEAEEITFTLRKSRKLAAASGTRALAGDTVERQPVTTGSAEHAVPTVIEADYTEVDTHNR
ncbi:DUF4407 domain-containing protein [Nocardia donostiensis]|uniref:DUF4407 domain-containing protein n=1 Tax=Nocardia donostiensis TaxID=1538463 RepID=A0A1V2THV9_9NOCA|nr:DUF4407 domain-containing protein [Nocardia donostiensis]ONM49109.1 hypothetical protein B0T46_09285 [Nocardia donostiensis]OQS14127.1 hypothetical protein B0T36_16455 [Nocardia donostiensis]OQS19712.1 hypothetical protein B0T44_12930 [Nocardia donostiensis]